MCERENHGPEKSQVAVYTVTDAHPLVTLNMEGPLLVQFANYGYLEIVTVEGQTPALTFFSSKFSTQKYYLNVNRATDILHTGSQ